MWCTILHHTQAALLYCTLLYRTAPYAPLYCTILHFTAPLYYTWLHFTAPYCTFLRMPITHSKFIIFQFKFGRLQSVSAVSGLGIGCLRLGISGSVVCGLSIVCLWPTIGCSVFGELCIGCQIHGCNWLWCVWWIGHRLPVWELALPLYSIMISPFNHYGMIAISDCWWWRWYADVWGALRTKKETTDDSCICRLSLLEKWTKVTKSVFLSLSVRAVHKPMRTIVIDPVRSKQ